MNSTPTPVTASPLAPIMTAWRDLPLHIRRGIIGGLIAGIVVIFLIMIGIPGGAGDANSLPAWFAWVLFLFVAAAFALFFTRPRGIVERRNAKAMNALAGGVVVGIVAASLTVTFMCAINAAQLWEINGPPSMLDSGLRSNITRVQDVFWNVTPRTTAVMSGLAEDDIRPPNPDTPRAEPTLRFFLVAALLPLAGVVGALGTVLVQSRQPSDNAATVSSRSVSGPIELIREWIEILMPIGIFGLILANELLSANGSSGGLYDAYKGLIGDNGQLIGLLLSFLLVGSGLLGLREAVGRAIRYTPSANAFQQRVFIGVALTVVFFGIGFLSPNRPANDMLFSAKAPRIDQITAPDGSTSVVPEPLAPVTDDQLILYRRLAIVGLGIVFALSNVIAARGRMPTRTLIALNVLLGTLAVTPLFLDKYQQSVLVLVGINILLGLGLNIVVGYAGLLDLGYVAFYAIGAYAYAFLSSSEVVGGNALKFAGNHDTATSMSAALVIGALITPVVIGFGLRFWRQRAKQATVGAEPERPAWLRLALIGGAVVVTLLIIALLQGTPLYASFGSFPVFVIGLIAGILCAATAGVMLGIPVLRLRGDYLAIVTLGFGEIIRLFLSNLKDVTGGPQGLLTIPHAAIGNVELGSNEGLLYLVLFGCLGVAVLSLRLKGSRLGRAWGALNSDEDIAQAMGINIVNTKVLAFCIGAAFAGVGGVIFAARQGSIFPENFTLDQSINVLSLVIIGGMGSIPGVIVGALVLVGVPESLRVFENYRILAFGALLIAMTILRPRGLLPQPPTPMEDRAAELSGETEQIADPDAKRLQVETGAA